MIDIAIVYDILEKHGLPRDDEDVQSIATALWMAADILREDSESDRLKSAQRYKKAIIAPGIIRRKLVDKLGKDQYVLDYLGIDKNKIDKLLSAIDEEIASRRTRTGPMKTVKEGMFFFSLLLLTRRGMTQAQRVRVVHDVLVTVDVPKFDGYSPENERDTIRKWDSEAADFFKKK